MIPRHEFWRHIVKEIEHTTSHPGYKHVYFSSFSEFDEYMRSTGHENWKETEWGKLIQYTGNDASNSRQPYSISEDDVVLPKAVYTQNKNDYEYIARELIRQGITDVDTLEALINGRQITYSDPYGSYTHTLKTTRKALDAYIKKYNSSKRRPSRVTPDYIIRALVNHYTSQGLSLRQVASKMSTNDGINISYETVRSYTK